MSRLLKLVVGVCVCFVLVGATCSGSGGGGGGGSGGGAPAPIKNPPLPERPLKPATYTVFDAFSYPVRPACSRLPAHVMPNAGWSLAQAAAADAWFGFYADSPGVLFSSWWDNSLAFNNPRCSAPTTFCDDANGADLNPLVVYNGHGYYPDSTDQEGGIYGFGKPPHLSLSFPFGYDSDPGLPCALRMGSNDPSHTDVALGSRNGALATHLVLHSSCNGQPRLMPSLLRYSRVTQVFGFMFSPTILDSSPFVPRVPVDAKRLGLFFRDTSSLGNAISWANNFGVITREDGVKAGAIANTFGLTALEAEQFATDTEGGVPRSSSSQHMLRAGQQVFRLLPSSLTYEDSITISSQSYYVAQDICKNVAGKPAFDSCGNPDPELCPFGSQLLGEPERFAQGTPSVAIPTDRNTQPTQVLWPRFGLRKRRPVFPDLAEATVSIAGFMTSVIGDPRLAETHLRANIAEGDWHYRELTPGVFVGFDPVKSRLRVLNAFPAEKTSQSGAIEVISWTDAERIVEDLLTRLPSVGLKDREYWSVDAPMLSLYSDRKGGVARPWQYSYTIFRKVNGIPVRDAALTVWVHRSGVVSYLQLTGLEDMLSGPPGDEFSSLPSIGFGPIRFSREDGLAKFQAKTGVPRASIIWANVSLQANGVKCSLREQDEDCAVIAPFLDIRFNTAPPESKESGEVGSAVVDLVSGEVFSSVQYYPQ